MTRIFVSCSRIRHPPSRAGLRPRGGAARTDVTKIKVMVKKFLTTASAALCLLISACMPKIETIRVTGITLDRTDIELLEGQSDNLKASVQPGNADDRSVTWTSADNSVATVSGTGQVDALKPGETRITATTTDGGFSAVCKVTVKQDLSVKGVTLSESSKEIVKRGSFTLTATITPSYAEKKGVSWSSSDTKVCTVDDSGTVNAVAYGTADVTATSEDGIHKASCRVTVIPDPDPDVHILVGGTHYVNGVYKDMSTALARGDDGVYSYSFTEGYLYDPAGKLVSQTKFLASFVEPALAVSDKAAYIAGNELKYQAPLRVCIVGKDGKETTKTLVDKCWFWYAYMYPGNICLDSRGNAHLAFGHFTEKNDFMVDLFKITPEGEVTVRNLYTGTEFSQYLTVSVSDKDDVYACIGYSADKNRSTSRTVLYKNGEEFRTLSTEGNVLCRVCGESLYALEYRKDGNLFDFTKDGSRLYGIQLPSVNWSGVPNARELVMADNGDVYCIISGTDTGSHRHTFFCRNGSFILENMDSSNMAKFLVVD